MNYKDYVDKYFIRSKLILEKEKLNPWIVMQIFTRKGPGKIAGINESIDFIKKFSDIEKQGGIIYSLQESDSYDANETIMLIEAPIQSIIEFETIYLGILSARTTRLNDKFCMRYHDIRNTAREIVNLAKRPVYYAGARHWHYMEDEMLNGYIKEGGFTNCSTDIGAYKYFKQEGVGTVPHALVIAFASKYGKRDATLQTALAFDNWIDKKVPRVILVDTFNKEIIDSVKVACTLKNNLYGIRLDTCGENYGENCDIVPIDTYEQGHGVTIELARRVRLALNSYGFVNTKIILSSGFADPTKVEAFIEAEKRLGIKLFDQLLVGQLFPSRSFTADIVMVNGELLSKTGREYKENKRLRRLL